MHESKCQTGFAVARVPPGPKNRLLGCTWRALLGGLAFAALTPSLKLAAADYKVQRGDVIEISVVGIPELRQRLPVQADGTVSLPLAGALRVAGLPLPDMRSEIQMHLARKIYRARSNDGREVLVIIQADEVGAAIVEYRPIYVNGDVAKPGEQNFRPEMTVLQAVAHAGGYDFTTGRTPNLMIDAATLRGERQLLWTDFAREQARMARVQAEMGGTDALDLPDRSSIPLPPQTLQDIAALETEILKARLADYRRERSFLKAAVDQADEQTAVIEKQQAAEQQGSLADTDELQKLVVLLSKGQVTSPRVIEARRALLLSSTRTLQITAQLLLLKKQKLESSRHLEQADDELKAKLLKELQEATLGMNTALTRREAAEEKLELVSRGHATGSHGEEMRVSIDVIRKDDRGVVRLAADENYVLMPGDVIDVALRAQNAPTVAGR